MALSRKLISFFFLFTLFFSQIYARESQFFSKVSGATTTTTTPTTVNNPATTTTVNGKERTIPNKEEENFNFKNQEQEPFFMPETQNGYGLYGQELNDQESNTHFPTTTKLGNAQYTTGTPTPTTSAATYTPYTTPTREPYAYYPNANANANYYNNNGFEDEQQHQNFGETSLQERSFSTPLANQNNYYKNNGGNGFFNQEGRQGMSDTRFLENGRYFHDIHNENPTNNYYNTPAGYYNNNNNNNNENTYQYDKYSMENQQEDFQERQDEQYVP